MQQQEVFQVLREERDYQNSLNPNWCHGGAPSIAEEILMMQTYLNRAQTSYTSKYGDKTAGLYELRCVAAMAVRCFENHGCPRRVWGEMTDGK